MMELFLAIIRIAGDAFYLVAAIITAISTYRSSRRHE